VHRAAAAGQDVLSIGKPLWGVTMRVADASDQPLPPGREHVGEILIRGHNVMKGYLGRPEGTAEALAGGWLHSGDLGYMDSDGFYFIVDRAKDLVIRGGYNVYPREIEEVLYAHPSVAEAAVIGKPDERLGEEVVAVVALRPGHEVGDIVPTAGLGKQLVGDQGAHQRMPLLCRIEPA
jgi:long-chain acyl-CoA synthetase